MKISQLKKYLPLLLQASRSEISYGEWGGGEKLTDGAITFPYITYQKWVTDFIYDCDCVVCFPKDL
ncbi:MAG: hypothetical protein J1F61_01420 [Clostridiales bacterium]|nr:hypothetical protein [Clostridiales bacterium]